MASEVDIAKVSEQLEIARAVAHAALEQLAALVAILERHGGYMTHDHQAELRHAKAMLVAAGVR